MKENKSQVIQKQFSGKTVAWGITILAIIAVAIGLWIFAYHNRKSLDNIPSLTLIMQEGETFGHERLQGYKREMLLEV